MTSHPLKYLRVNRLAERQAVRILVAAGVVRVSDAYWEEEDEAAVVMTSLAYRVSQRLLNGTKAA